MELKISINEPKINEIMKLTNDNKDNLEWKMNSGKLIISPLNKAGNDILAKIMTLAEDYSLS